MKQLFLILLFLSFSSIFSHADRDYSYVPFDFRPYLAEYKIEKFDGDDCALYKLTQKNGDYEMFVVEYKVDIELESKTTLELPLIAPNNIVCNKFKRFHRKSDGSYVFNFERYLMGHSHKTKRGIPFRLERHYIQYKNGKPEEVISKFYNTFKSSSYLLGCLRMRYFSAIHQKTCKIKK